MASIEKRKDGSYRIVVSCGYDVGGKKIRKYKTIKLPPNLTERQKQNELLRQKILFENEVLNKNYLDGEKITFAEFTEIWIEKHAKIKYAPASLKPCLARLKDRIIPELGHHKLSKIQTYHLEEFYNKLKVNFRGQYTSDVITSGYHLNDYVIQKLKEIKITEIQITLDGLPQRHNKIKHIKGCSDVFNQTILNLDNLFALYPEIRVCIRINLIKENAKEYSTLYRFLLHRYSGNRISVSPGFVIDTGILHKCDLFTHSECAEFSLSLWDNEQIPTPWMLINKKDTECAIRNINSIAIDAEGYFYKCWEKISSPKHRFAKINHNGEVDFTDIEVLNSALHDSDPLEDSECSKCAYLPLCFGGCPMRRIEKATDNCTSYKNNQRRWLIAYMELKRII